MRFDIACFRLSVVKISQCQTPGLGCCCCCRRLLSTQFQPAQKCTQFPGDVCAGLFLSRFFPPFQSQYAVPPAAEKPHYWRRRTSFCLLILSCRSDGGGHKDNGLMAVGDGGMAMVLRIGFVHVRSTPPHFICGAPPKMVLTLEFYASSPHF